jgi:outer membrane lipoprotein
LIQAPDYRLPKLSADVIYLWPEQRQVDVVPYPYGPWGPSPYGPYWGYGRWGWW